jgi:hypothetical protein
MAALRKRDPGLGFDIFTMAPEWFFQDSLSNGFRYHAVQTDVGLIQISPTREDLPATTLALTSFIASIPKKASDLAGKVLQSGCRMIICDISPLGIATALAAGLPAVLIENFTWDWIYEGYHAAGNGLKPSAAYFAGLYRQARFRIQTQPVCRPQKADLTTRPVSRNPQKEIAQVRSHLGIADHTPLVLITMGGIPACLDFLDAVQRQKEIVFVVCGAHETACSQSNLIILPEHSAFFHPDLVQAADAVIGKVGYSTLAEVYHAGIPFGYVPRPAFRESDTLSAFIESQMSGALIPEADFTSGAWIDKVPELLQLPRIPRTGQNGADQIAAFIAGLI